jgi:hypothetical protein
MQAKKHKTFDPETVANSNGFFHRVRLPWEGQSNYFWNEACADIIEVFGMPGGRFTSNPQHDYMDFFFKSKKDAELCKILLSDKF